MRFLWRGDVDGRRAGAVVDRSGRDHGLDLELAAEAETAHCAAVLLFTLSSSRLFLDFIEADAWGGTTASQYSIISALAVELFVKEVVCVV